MRSRREWRCWARRPPPTTASWATCSSSSRAPAASRCAPTAARWPGRACGWRCSSCPGRPSGWPGSSSTCPTLPGSGIVYTLTKRDAEQVAAFLTANGIAALAYSGEQETEDRIATEERLLRNEIKAVVATSALGMGYDKPDLTFVVHYQAPGLGRLVLPAGRPRRPRRRARRRRAAARRRGPPDPGLLHRAGLPVARAGRRRFWPSWAMPGRRPHDARADGRGEPRHGPDRGDAEDPRRRGRRPPRRARAGS